MAESDQGRLLKVSELAAMLRVSPAWVRQHANGTRKEPQIPTVKMGKLLRFRADEIQRWLEQMRAAC